MQIGFIGVGNMARAIIDGLVAAKAVTGSDLHLHSGHLEHYQAYAESLGAQIEPDNSAVVANSDVVFLAVKPKMVDAVLTEVHSAFTASPTYLVSMVSGIDLASLRQIAGPTQPMLRIMPNLNVAIGAGMTAYAPNPAAATSDVTNSVVGLLARIGGTVELPEDDFATFVGLAGSSPAFVYEFIDAMASVGVKYGLTKKVAVQIAAQAVAGSAELVLARDSSPSDLADAVASPGGTTIRGMLAMQAAGFKNAVVAGLDATIAMDKGE